MNTIMISAGFEQSGNTMHRHLDGHPELFVYPFESMMGTQYSHNLLTPSVHFKYAYPEFLTNMTGEQAYQSIYDEEMKTFLRTPGRSKFKDCGMKMDENDRINYFISNTSLTRKNYVEAYFASTFSAWENLKESGKEKCYVGYSPMILMDADKFFFDFPDGKMIHMVRSPLNGYQDTLKRPFPYSLTKYCQIWNIAQLTALNLKQKYPNNFKIVKFEDLCLRKEHVMKDVAKFLSIDFDKSLLYPSFNGKKLNKIYPWGTIENANLKTYNDELSLNERDIDRIWIETRVIHNLIYV